MRVALILPGFCADECDPGIPALRNLVTALGREHELCVYAVFHPLAGEDFELGPVRVRAFGRARPNFLRQFAQMHAALRALRADHARRPFDLVHGLWADLGGFPAVRAGRALGLPTLVSIIGGELDHVDGADYGKARRLNGRLARYAVWRAGAVAVLSETHRAQLHESLPWLAAECLPFGVDTALFEPAGPRVTFGAGRHLLCVASLLPVKGQLLLLQALRRARHALPDLQLHLIGDGPCRGELELQALTIGLEDCVRFHGRQPHALLPAWYRAADFCVQASWFETSGMVSFEAAACGRLTLGSGVGSLPELTPAELLCAPGESQGLAAAIAAAFALPPDRRQELEREVRAKVLRHYTVPAMAARYVGEYERLVAGAAARGPVACKPASS